MRKLLIGFAISIGAVAAGLLLASLFLKQECPDCSGTARYLAENPSQCIEGPAVLDCPRCGDLGLVSLFNGYVAPAPDPLVAALLRHSNRNSWNYNTVAESLGKRLEESPIRTVEGRAWTPGRAMFGRSRFIREEGKRYLLLIHQVSDWSLGHAGVRICLFDPAGKLLDILDLTAHGGASNPTATYVIPYETAKPCIRIALLVWKNRPFDLVEVDRAGKPWKLDPPPNQEKLDQLEWMVFVRQGRLQIADAGGKSIAE